MSREGEKTDAWHTSPTTTPRVATVCLLLLFPKSGSIGISIRGVENRTPLLEIPLWVDSPEPTTKCSIATEVSAQGSKPSSAGNASRTLGLVLGGGTTRRVNPMTRKFSWICRGNDLTKWLSNRPYSNKINWPHISFVLSDIPCS